MVQALIRKMGWERIPYNRAEDVLCFIANNYICCQSDCCGVQPSSTHAAFEIFLSADMSSDNLWTFYFINDYQSLNNQKLAEIIPALRPIVERLLQYETALDVRWLIEDSLKKIGIEIK